MKPEFYTKGTIQYCRLRVGDTDIDAPVEDVVIMMSGLGVLLLIGFLIALASDSKPIKTT